MQYDQLTWIFQSNNINGRDRSALKQAAIQLGCATQEIGIVPFSHEAIGPLPTIAGPCVVYGSGGLLDLAAREGWMPGGWDGESFNTSQVQIKFGNLALNDGGKEVLLANAATEAAAYEWDKIFLRPVSESKEFPGIVYELHELQEWIGKLHSANYFADQNSLMLLAPFKTLGREWRAFVADNNLVSVSQYAEGGIRNSSSDVPDAVWEFVSKVIRIYTPAPCFVIDIAEDISDGSAALRVVEFNSMNSSGLYDCDAEAIVRAVSDNVLK